MSAPLALDSASLDPASPEAVPADSELTLARAAAGGDEAAFSEIFRRHRQRIWAVCRGYLEAAAAEDATQETFLKAWARLGDFDGRARLSTWLTRIAINTCLDQLRRRGRRPHGNADESEQAEARLEALPSDEDPERHTGVRQLVDRLQGLEDELSPRQREVFRLRFYAQLELAEIAGALCVSLGTVKTQLHRAVHRVRAGLGEVLP